MKLSTPLFLLSAALFSSACGSTWSIRSVRGSGIRKQEARQVGDFHSVALAIQGDVLLEVGPAPSLTITTDDNLLPLITTRVSSGNLRIRKSENIRTSQGVEIHITTPSLDGFSISGSASVRIKGVKEKSFEAHISGSGDMTITGRVEKLEASISGSGDLRLADLKAQEASIRISGSGDVSVNVDGALRYSISGSGDIHYSGDAKPSGRVSGSGSVTEDTRPQ